MQSSRKSGTPTRATARSCDGQTPWAAKPGRIGSVVEQRALSRGESEGRGAAPKKPKSDGWRKFHHTATSVRRLCLLVVLDVNSRRVGQMPPFSDDILPGLRISLCVVLRAVRTGAAETHPTHPILAKGPIARIAPI